MAVVIIVIIIFIVIVALCHLLLCFQATPILCYFMLCLVSQVSPIEHCREPGMINEKKMEEWNFLGDNPE